MQLSVPPANANEAPAANVLTRDDHVYLKRLWAKFHDSIHKLDENDILSDLSTDTPSNLSDDEEKNKRDQSVCVTDKDSDKELEPVQHNTKRMHTYQVGTSNFEVYAPRHIHVGSASEVWASDGVSPMWPLPMARLPM